MKRSLVLFSLVIFLSLLTACSQRPAPATESELPDTLLLDTLGELNSHLALSVLNVTASSHDGNLPENTLDGNLKTRWSALGDGQWITFELASEQTVSSLEIAFYRGDHRITYFDVATSRDATSWTEVFSGHGSGLSKEPESFEVTETLAKYIRITGHKNSENDWNSITEVEVHGRPGLPIKGVTASSHDGNGPENTLDQNLRTRWSALGDGQWIRYDVGTEREVEVVKIAFYRGNRRVTSFDIETSRNGSSWQRVFSGQSSGATHELETFAFGSQKARYVRIVGHKNSENAWNSLTEVEIHSPATGAETPTVWPNSISRANSDRWLIEHHDDIRQMRPKLLVINFSNLHTPSQVEQKLQGLIAALAESSRWHGYDDADAPVFLDYQVAKMVDLRDGRSSCDGNSHHYPRKPQPRFNFDYKQLYGETFAKHYGYPDPDKPGRFLALGELVERGLINEVWFLAAQKDECGYPYETVELKTYYNESFEKIGSGPAGNGHDIEIPRIGRSLRINYINMGRGVGCAMHNLGHALERMRSAVPYYDRYFTEYADFDLDERYGLPFDSFYAYRRADVHNPKPDDDQNIYPDPNTLVAQFRGETYTLPNYVARGGNVHFPPNARQHYDEWSPYTVMSTIKNWRVGNGPGGEDLAEPFTVQAFERYSDLAPDCTGSWLVYWRQNMSGLDNLALDDAGEPMKNWWPFLFY